MRSCLIHAAVSLVLALCCAGAANAQLSGVVRGTVTDVSGAGLIGASVTLENATGGYRQHTNSDEEGRFTFFNVPFDSYTLKIEQSGFTAATKGIALRTSVPVERDIMLAVAPTNERGAEPAPIADNSFLIEEAYNQEAGVVQHVSTFSRTRDGDFQFSFTQEFPFFDERHQLSYTLPAARAAASDGGRGVGDIALNYRYQLVSNKRVAVAPRASLLLPTGDEGEGLGAGNVGIQFNLPISARVSRRFVAHSNAGATFTPRARNGAGDRAGTRGYNLGQSLVWLARPRFNVLVEGVWNRTELVVGANLKDRSDSLTVNPGVRWSHNFRSGLQIVPGISIPIGVGSSRGERGVFFYLSFEHPFRKQ